MLNGVPRKPRPTVVTASGDLTPAARPRHPRIKLGFVRFALFAGAHHSPPTAASRNGTPVPFPRLPRQNQKCFTRRKCIWMPVTSQPRSHKCAAGWMSGALTLRPSIIGVRDEHVRLRLDFSSLADASAFAEAFGGVVLGIKDAAQAAD
jgi:hypothetical protein